MLWLCIYLSTHYGKGKNENTWLVILLVANDVSNVSVLHQSTIYYTQISTIYLWSNQMFSFLPFTLNENVPPNAGRKSANAIMESFKRLYYLVYLLQS